MEGDINGPVYIIIQKENKSEEETEKFIYLPIKSQSNNEIQNEPSTSHLVQDDSVEQEFDASTVFNSGVKIVTLDDDKFFYISMDEDENVQSIEPHLISSQNIEQSTIDIDDNSLELSNYKEDQSNTQIINLIDTTYEMVMLTDDRDTTVDSTVKKKFKCQHKGCEKAYANQHHLVVHSRTHLRIKPYVCTYGDCEKTFSTNYTLKAHFRTHTGEKPFACQVCLKSFKTSGDLQKHIRTHTGEKPFYCPIAGCGKSFTTSNIRKVHIRSHTGERPYVCDYPNCGKGFASSTNYKNHARIHSGEKPYVCPVKGCDKRFTEYSSLYKHSAVHQIDRPFECDYSDCKQKFKSEHTRNIHKKVKHGVLISQDGLQVQVDVLDLTCSAN